MPYEISKKDCIEMKKLMDKIVNKNFNEADNKRLTTLSSRFLFITRAIGYTDGYILKK